MQKEQTPLTTAQKTSSQTAQVLEDAGRKVVTKDEKLFMASQWQLMWWRFTRHKLAVISSVVVLLLYLVALFVEFLAPYDPNKYYAAYQLNPPMPVRFVDSQGDFSLRPFVYARTRVRDPFTLAYVYTDDPNTKHYLYFFTRTGQNYKLWGQWTSDLHLFGVKEKDAVLFLLGTDRLGRDMFSRVIYGARLSMSIGLVGVALSLLLGILLGGISGYFSGWIDLVIQRIIEFIQVMPTIPLWMALAASFPLDWSPARQYFMITVILSLVGWTGLARVVRGRFLSLREEDFVKAARLAGSSEMRIIFRHMLPSFMSHIIATVTLAIPSMILAETSLSFLGVGLKPPVVSWGVLLQEAQNLRTVALAPWNLAPAVPVVIAILALNFMGDGLRDAADPYQRT
jgi:peptide/nickel transport system permease protein